MKNAHKNNEQQVLRSTLMMRADRSNKSRFPRAPPAAGSGPASDKARHYVNSSGCRYHYEDQSWANALLVDSAKTIALKPVAASPPLRLPRANLGSPGSD